MLRGRFGTIIFALLTILWQSSCSSSKFLKSDEYLLKKNEIIIQSDEKIANKPSLKYELSTLYNQEVNNKFFFIPREWVHLKTSPPKEGKKLRSWINRTIGESPVLFDEEQAEGTVKKMKAYMVERGYFNAEVFYEDEQKGKSKVHIKYYVQPNKRLLVDTIEFSADDPQVDSILQAISSRSLLRKGDPLDIQLINREKARIREYLKNHGYYRFSSSHFPRQIDVDTTDTPNGQAHLYLHVNLPYKDSLHRVFRVGKVSVYPHFNIKMDDSELEEHKIGEVSYFTNDKDSLVRLEVINDAIYLKQGNIYSQRDFDVTIRTLQSFSIYQTPRIKSVPDSLNPQILNFRIDLTPEKLNVFRGDVELDFTNRSNVTNAANNIAAGNLIGVNVSPNWQNRNFLHGAELFSANLGAGVEMNPNPQEGLSFWNTIDFSAQTDLLLPRFRDYFGFWRLMDKLSFRRENPDEEYSSFYQGLQTQAATRVSASYNYVLLLNFYRYNLLAASYGYDFQKDANNRYVINNLSIDYFDPTTELLFQEIQESNPFLERSFGDQLFVSLLFREFSYSYSGPTKRLGGQKNFAFNVETAGSEIWTANSIYNAFSSQADTFSIGSVDFSQYIRIEGDASILKSYSENQAFAARVAMGIARPFGFSTDVPYVKQFYVGGPNSIRAWAARSLGPGGFIDSLTLDNNNPLLFYQAGDLRLEFNAEYRFKMFSRLNGAFFLDGGNIWTVRNDETRPGSQFLLRSKEIQGQDGKVIIADPFYKQIALGTGFGFRFDFKYFIFRLDLGIRLRYPYKWREDRYWVLPDEWFEDINFNFSLGYPF